MVIYIDETENEQYFILAGLLIPSRDSAETAYKRFKKRISRFSLNSRAKEMVFREFKSTVLDRHYQRIKYTMLEEINRLDNHSIIYCSEYKKSIHLTQDKKEELYIHLITNIIKKCEKVSVIYDCFNNSKFESRINNEIKRLANVESIEAKDSQVEHGLQFVDNLCSVIRLHISKADIYNYFDIISSNVIKV